MISLLLNKKMPGKIGVLELDATVHETHEYTNTLTEFPVEKGFKIADHVIRMPEKLTIEGFITNSPVPRSSNLVQLKGENAGALVTEQNQLTQSYKYEAGFNRVENALSILLNYAGLSSVTGSDENYTQLFPKVIDMVDTGLRQYVNMVIVRLSIPRDARTGEAMQFTCEMRHVVIVNTETVVLQNVSELNGRAVNASKQATAETKKGAQNGKTESKTKSDSLLFKAEMLLQNWVAP